MKYLTLIRTVTLLHQYQREVKHKTRGGRAVEYIETTLRDIAVATGLAHEVLGRSLDELPPQTRQFLGDLTRMVRGLCNQKSTDRAACRFSRRGVREATRWSATQIRVHLDRLVELEYVLVHRGGLGRRFVYELLWDGDCDNASPHLPGLVDVSLLVDDGSMTSNLAGQTGNLAVSKGEVAGWLRPENGGVAVGVRGASNAPEATHGADASKIHESGSTHAHLGQKKGADRNVPELHPHLAAEGRTKVG